MKQEHSRICQPDGATFEFTGIQDNGAIPRIRITDGAGQAGFLFFDGADPIMIRATGNAIHQRRMDGMPGPFGVEVADNRVAGKAYVTQQIQKFVSYELIGEAQVVFDDLTGNLAIPEGIILPSPTHGTTF